MKSEDYKEISIVFYDDFKCTGNECRDNCCGASYWSIHVDKVTMKKYENLDTELREEILSGIELKNNVNVMKSRSDGYCINLEQDGLCKIHRLLGEDYLCDTCRSYPLHKNTFDNYIEYMMTLSCPVVAEKLLFFKEGIYFDVRETTEPIKKINVETEKSLEVLEYTLSEKISFDIKMLSTNILKNRNYPLWQRISYLGLMMRSISKISKDETIDSKTKDFKIIENLIVFEKNMDDQQIYNELGKLSTKNKDKELDESFYFVMLKLLEQFFTKYDFDNQTINKEFYNKLKNIEKVSDSSSEILEVRQNIFNKYLNDNEYVFENYLVWYLFHSKFPYSYGNLDLAYKGFIFQYILLQLFICTVYKENEKLEDDDIINAVYYFSRKIGHHGNIIVSYEKIMNEYKFIDLAFLVYILGTTRQH